MGEISRDIVGRANWRLLAISSHAGVSACVFFGFFFSFFIFDRRSHLVQHDRVPYMCMYVYVDMMKMCIIRRSRSDVR